MLLYKIIVVKKASLPIPHIVAIILGLVVIGLIGYLLFQHFTEGERELTFGECYAKFSKFCVGNPQGTLEEFLGKTPACDLHKDGLPKSCEELI
ncbi:MAG: hypothetical protein J7L39_02410 [Candidatus Aenigmarchaeota archaeon]|nr:hypothetical protein [Candidatus Aenigmarchaeota archaeon]